jgi:hypothetical protein
MTFKIVRDQVARGRLRGTYLQNGALCIAAAPATHDGEFIVLAFRDHPVDPYVVWKADSAGNCWQGDYCTTLMYATARFFERSGASA